MVLNLPLRAVVDPHHTGRWLVLDRRGKHDGRSYPSRAAAEAAARNPSWADSYALAPCCTDRVAEG
jgi:hypothetical protein